MKKNKVNKYCPVCYQEDINNYGFAIWHLDHQIPEILVCTIHHCFLLSCPETLKSLSRSSFIDINSFQHIDLTFKKCESMLTLKIASEMIAILKGVSTFNVSKAEYQSRLKHFYSSNSESLDSKNFTNELKLFYSGDEILSKYLSNNNWPVQLIKRPGHFFHPIRHLIINQFVNSITKVIVNPKKPFGNGPWVCINKACKQYGLYSIPAYTMHSETKSGREIYSFECECGMIYSKSCLGNGTAILDVPKIKIWGHVWDRALVRLKEAKLTHRAIGRKLGTDAKTIKNRFELLKVQSQLVIPFNELMIEYKELWTIELEKYSSNQVANARKSLGYIYTYLYRHDRNWLLTINKIKSRKVIAAQLKLDWPQLDNHYAEQISHVVNKLKVENLKGRITKNIIVSALNGHSHILSKHKNKLPNSFARLDLFIESKTEYAIRRVNFAVKQLKLDFDHPAKWRILRSAGISKHSSEDVIRYVDSIIQKIAS